jgi:hypothetical protein
MHNSKSEYFNVLAIAPVSKGFGFVFMRDRHTLLDWGTRSVKKADKNKKTIIKVEKLIKRFEPDLVVLPDVAKKSSRRQDRICKLVKLLVLRFKRRGIAVCLISKEQLRSYFFNGARGTKHKMAQVVANRFPDQLDDLMPPERQQWMNENHFMQLFDAAAIGLTSFSQTANDDKNSNPALTASQNVHLKHRNQQTLL